MGVEIGDRAARRMATFVGGTMGAWRVVKMQPVVGTTLEPVARITVFPGYLATQPQGAKWMLRGITSHVRYTERPEHEALRARQPDLGRREATRAALIPITKSASWWELSQDERRAIFETRSGHIRTGLKYLPAVARKLYHCRDLGGPFDFLTWFEYAPAHVREFEDLVKTLRQSEEWTYVEREIDIRLSRESSAPTSTVAHSADEHGRLR